LTKVEWDPAWETGIEIIDFQHRYLLDQLNRLIAAPDPESLETEAGRALDLLLAYVDFHFKLEETFMDSTGFGAFPEHQAAHDRMREQARRLVRDRGQLTGRQGVRVRDYLIDWLVNHISTEDRRMAKHLKRFIAEKGWASLPGSRIADR
jgi:hemerythrin-like metal-binding protein